MTVSGAVLENGIDRDPAARSPPWAPLTVPAGAHVIDGSGKTVYPGLIDGLTTSASRDQSVPGTVDTTETGDVNPHAKAWVALHPTASCSRWRAPTASPPPCPRRRAG